jgi:enolase
MSVAVATNCGQSKTGSLSRTDRLAKYNQLPRTSGVARQERGLRGHERVAEGTVNRQGSQFSASRTAARTE